MIMAKHSVSVCTPDVGRPFAFKIEAMDSIPLYVAADSELEAERWLAILNEAAKKEDAWITKRYLMKNPKDSNCFVII